MVQSSKTFRVFVSSTFSDMKEERNALQKEVFPKLRKLCMEHGFRFQAIDLRWGVSEEAGLDQQTMKICLEEIERSQRVSPKPNFIVLLGDRYGWRPLPYEIPADEFEEIKSVIHDEDDRKFLFWEGDVLTDDLLKKREGWYCKDENAVPPVYCLKPRLADYDEDASDDEIKKARDLEYKDWEKIEKRLKSILLNAINDLGWDKDDSRRFKYESSATEQEIIKGVLKLPEDSSLSEEHVFSFIRKIKDKKSIPFDDYSKDFFDFDENNEMDDSAEEKLVALKNRIDSKLPSSNIFDYETEWEGKGVNKQHIKKLCDDVYSSLKKVIAGQINEFEEKYPLDIEIEAHKEFGKERCKFFKGREDNRAQIKNYLENPNSKPLIVYGESGSGKSALMAQVVQDLHPNFYKTPVDNVVVRFIGATPETSDIRSLLESLSRQITKIYDEDDSHIPTEYKDLVQDFKERLNFLSVEKPLFIFLDALDQLSDFDSAHDLTWIPDELPENVHIVISTLKNIFQSSLETRRGAENTVEVLPLEDNDGKGILNEWFKDYKRKLTDKQEAEVINKFKVDGLPLYLKLAFEESKLWKSYTPVPKFESDIKWMITSLFERLSRPENHGEMLVSRGLGYLSAAKNGLTEDEMLDILAMDEDVFNLTKKFHEPSENKLPVALWSRLYFDLEPYLTEKSADETSLLAFYHRQLGEVARAKYLDNTVKKSRYQLIAEYFYKQNLYFEQDEVRIYNVRKVSELPYQETYGECWKSLENTLCDLRFVEAKCAVGMTYNLIKDYNLALDLHPDAQEESQKKLEHEKHVEKYVEDLIAYSNGEISHLNTIPSAELWGQEKINIDREPFINNPNSLNNIKAFYHLISSDSATFAEFGHLTGFCLQQAYNSAKSGPVAEKAKQILNNEQIGNLILKNENSLPDFIMNPAQLKLMEDHVSQIIFVKITPDGKKAVSISEYKPFIPAQLENASPDPKIWDLKTGEHLINLEGYEGKLQDINISADSKKVFGRYKNIIIIWDLETGTILKKIKLTNFVSSIKIIDDNKKALIRSKDESFCVRDLKAKKFLNNFEFTDEITALTINKDGNEAERDIWVALEDITNGVSSMAITLSGKKAVSNNYDGKLRLWDLETKKCLKTIDRPNNLSNLLINIDGNKAISAIWEDVIHIWDFQTGELLKTLEGHTDCVISISITPDGKRAVSCSYDKTLRVWNLETGKCLNMLECCAYAVAITPDGKKAIIIDQDGCLRLLNLKKGKCLKNIEPWKLFKIRPMPRLFSCEVKLSLDITPDGKKAISGNGTYDVSEFLLYWNLVNGEVQKLEGHSNKVNVVVFTPDGKKAVSGSYDNTLILWDLKTGKNKLIFKGHINSVEAVDITPDGKKAVSGSLDKTLRVWDLETGKCLKILRHTYPINYVSITSNGKTIISGGQNDKEVQKWDLETGKCLKTINGPGYLNSVVISSDGKMAISRNMGQILILWNFQTGYFKKIKGYANYINSIDISLNGKKAITGSKDGALRVWDLENGEISEKLRSESNIISVAITSDGKKAISGSMDGSLCLWDLEIVQLLKIYKGHNNDVNTVSITFDGNMAISGGHDRTLRLWDLEKGENPKIKNKFKGHIKRMKITPDNKRAIILNEKSFDENIIYILDQETGNCIKKLELPNQVLNIFITPNNKKLISINKNKTYSIWDLETIKPLKSFKGEIGMFEDDMIITPDGRNVLILSGTIIIWNLETGKKIKELNSDSRIHYMTITPDGKKVITGSIDYKLRIWDLETGKYIKKIENIDCSLSNTSITPDGNKIVHYKRKNIKIWNLETRRVLNTIEIDEYDFDRINFKIAPNGKKIILIRFNNADDYYGYCISFLDLETGECIGEIKGSSLLKLVEITPDGKKAIIGSGDRTLNVWDLETGKTICVSKEKSPIRFLTINADSNLTYVDQDNIFFSRLTNTIILPLVTAIRMWLSEENEWDNDIKAKCDFCGKYFTVNDNILNTIKELENQYKKPNGWIADEAWEDPRLISECPFCSEKLKFNPFIVDNSNEGLGESENLYDLEELDTQNDEIDVESDYGIHEELEGLEDTQFKEESENSSIKEKRKKSRWKFWK